MIPRQSSSNQASSIRPFLAGIVVLASIGLGVNDADASEKSRTTISSSTSETKTESKKLDPIPTSSADVVESKIEVKVAAPVQFVWDVLTKFEDYPDIFPRIRSVKVTKVDGPYVYTQSFLKKQLFISVPAQTVVNDLSKKPHALRWGLIKGNFKSARGLWELSSAEGGKSCKVKYTLASTHGPIPDAVFGMTLKMVQKDIVKSLKKRSEQMFKQEMALKPKTNTDLAQIKISKR